MPLEANELWGLQIPTHPENQIKPRFTGHDIQKCSVNQDQTPLGANDLWDLQIPAHSSGKIYKATLNDRSILDLGDMVCKKCSVNQDYTILETTVFEASRYLFIRKIYKAKQHSI